MPCGVLAAHQVAGALGRDHRDVDVRGRGDLAEVDVEAVREHQHRARAQVGRDLVPVERRLDVVGHEHHDHVGLGGRLGHRGDGQAVGRGRRPGARVGPRADHDRVARVVVVQGVGVALAAVADHGDRLAGERRRDRSRTRSRSFARHLATTLIRFRVASSPSRSSAIRPVRTSSRMPYGRQQLLQRLQPVRAARRSESVIASGPTSTTRALEHLGQRDDLRPPLGRRGDLDHQQLELDRGRCPAPAP